MEEGLLALKNSRCLTEELFDQLRLAGCGGIDRDHQLLDFSGLTVFIFLDERKIPVQFHPVVVESVVEGVRVDPRLLPDHRIAPEKVAVAHPLSVLHRKHPDKISHAGAALRSEGKQFVLEAFRSRLPGLAQGILKFPGRTVLSVLSAFLSAAAVLFFVSHFLPEAVIIRKKEPAELLLLPALRPVLRKIPVDPLGCECLHGGAKPVVDLPAGIRHDSGDSRRVFNRIHDRLDCDIAGQIPQDDISALRHPVHMAEQAVQEHMHIDPGQTVRIIQISVDQKTWIAAQELRIRAERERRPVRDPGERIHRGSHEGQRQIELCPHLIDDFFPCLPECVGGFHLSIPHPQFLQQNSNAFLLMLEAGQNA